ncbi:MAG: hypothetical protein HRT66_09750 [Flavobacteriaceae bacterium]|nr:hypothetical protein [Flavobacteriaceae bacterium]
MKSRKEILEKIISFDGELSVLKKELSKYPWDVEEPYLVISKSKFIKILKKSIDQVITFEDLEYWANIIECRDDLDFEVELIQEMVFELSSPEINGEITRIKLQYMIEQLSM